MRIPILAKVIESMTQSVEQVAGTMVLGFCIQYIAVGAGFLLFSQGYGFADKDTSACSTLMECLRAHFDYGFRSAPVWSGPKLTYTRFTFDYVYNLVIILIMAAIISGIIIDAFADLKEEQKSIEEKMKSSCFICSLSKSELERKRVKFENHILKEHYMWAYARFLLYLEETDPAELNGPESYVKQQIKENNTGFFPIARCIAMESSDAGEEHLEREVRVKDLDEFKEKINSLAEDTEIMIQTERGMKADMKELRDVVTQQSQKVQAGVGQSRQEMMRTTNKLPAPSTCRKTHVDDRTWHRSRVWCLDAPCGRLVDRMWIFFAEISAYLSPTRWTAGTRKYVNRAGLEGVARSIQAPLAFDLRLPFRHGKGEAKCESMLLPDEAAELQLVLDTLDKPCETLPLRKSETHTPFNLICRNQSENGAGQDCFGCSLEALTHPRPPNPLNPMQSERTDRRTDCRVAADLPFSRTDGQVPRSLPQLDLGVTIHDPDDLLGRDSIDIAGEQYTKDGLPHVKADHLAQELGFNGAEPGVLVALSARVSAVSVDLAGSLLQADLPGGEEHLLESDAWLSAEALCRALLRSGDYISAAEAALRGLLQALTHSVESIAPHGSFKQKELDKWESEYQVGEVWLNMCGEKVCRELVLGDVRQLSDGFERYYHEALVYPALNLLGAQKRKVLILGGGDGGVATAALRFDTVEQIVNVDIDTFVTQAATKWFPTVAAGLNDSRCEMLHLDAFSWVEEQYNSGRSTFDLVVIDFTDEPVKGAWSKKFFSEVRGLLTKDGIVVQNVGTIANPEDMRKLYGLHADVFPAVFPLHAMVPDYLGPYMLVLSSAKPLDPAAVNWDHWQRQQILGQYYGGAAQHHALFRHIPADVSRLLGLSLSFDEKESLPAPSSVVRPLPFFKRGTSGNEKVVVKVKGIDGSKVQVSAEGNSLSFYQDRDLLLDAKSLERDEVLVLPALAVLGSRAQSVLVLGGGTGGVAALALKWPTVEKIVVVEVDEVVLKVVRKHFPKQAEVLSDPRVELVLEDVFVWLTQDKRSFDLVVVNMLDQPWLPPRRTTRLPRTKAFYRLLMAKVASGGCLTQEAGSAAMPEQFGSMLSIHRSIFVSTWPMAMSSSSPQPAVPGDEFDGIYFRLPRLFLLSTVNVLSPLQ
ncbi:IP3R, partial [Symbiodinium necroappetens]